MTIALLHCKACDNPHIINMETDPNLTFQEFALYWALRVNATNDDEATEESLSELMSLARDSDFINNTWPQLPASKYNKKEITIPWMDVFK